MTAVAAEPWAGIIGVQVPRLRVAPAWSVPPPAAVEAIEQGEAYGAFLDGWQQLLLFDSMDERADGRWESTEIDLIAARQNGKNGAVRVRQLYGLFTLGSRALHTAHEFKTAREHFDKMLLWIESYDELRREVAGVRTSHGEEGIRLHRRPGQEEAPELRFIARSKGSGRGFDPDDLYYDEALILTKATLSTSMMAQSASPNPQRWFFSSAGTPASEVLGRHRRRALAVLAGRRPRGRFVWHEYSPDFDGMSEAEKSEARQDPRVWAQANPGMPHRVTPETISEELDSLGDGPDFDRERLSVGDWPVEDGEFRWEVIAARAWAARAGARPRPAPCPPLVLAVAGSWPDAKFCTVAACWEDGEELVVEVVDRRRGTGWVIPRLEKLAVDFGRELRGVAVAKSGPAAAALLGDLQETDLPLLVLDTGQETAAAAGFRADVDGDAPTVRHYGQAVLDESVGAAGKHHIGDRWRWDRNGTSDPVEAVTLAHAGYSAAQPKTPAFY